jgi:transposase
MPKMNKKTGRPGFRYKLGPHVSNKNSLSQYEAAFRRWLARELVEGRLSTAEASKRFKIPEGTIFSIKREFSPQVVFLEEMTEAEKHKLEELQKRIKQLEKQLEDAAIKNIALETLVDVAEKQLNIPIRKKPGAKQ